MVGLTHYMRPVRKAAPTRGAAAIEGQGPRYIRGGLVGVAPAPIAQFEQDRIPADRALPRKKAEKRVERPLQEALAMQPAKVVDPASPTVQVRAFFAASGVFERHEPFLRHRAKSKKFTWAIRCIFHEPGDPRPDLWATKGAHELTSVSNSICSGRAPAMANRNQGNSILH
jgi:hypothetical protein